MNIQTFVCAFKMTAVGAGDAPVLKMWAEMSNYSCTLQSILL